MKRHHITLLFILFAVALRAENPNILFIYTDQQRYNTIHSLGNAEISTPNLDRLVKWGTAFTSAFVASPVCLPSRWSLHSGMYTTSHKSYSNHHKAKETPTTSLPEELRNFGYKTAVVGKNHSYLNKKRVDIMESGSHNNYRPKDGRSADEASDWSVESDDMYSLTNRTIELFQQKDDQPLFVWLSYLYPHTPFICPEPFFSMYDTVTISVPHVEAEGLEESGKPFRQQYHQLNNDLALPYNMEQTMRMKRTYYAMISMIDAEIGRLLDFLEQNELLENTLIVFSSDHGDYQGDHGLYTKSPSMYDCLTRVPLIFSYPKVISSHQIRNDLVSSVDIMPTLLDLVDIPLPIQVQGHSLLSELKGGSSATNRDYVFAEYGIPGKPILENELQKVMSDYKEVPIRFSSSMPWEGNPVALSGRIRMIRSHKFKFVKEVGGTDELYDLEKDPFELENLSGKRNYRSIESEMSEVLDHWTQNLEGSELDTVPLGATNFSKYLEKRF